MKPEHVNSFPNRSADFQVCRAAGFQTHRSFSASAGTEVADTAGLETCATNDRSVHGPNK
jgi:hypothetical protein